MHASPAKHSCARLPRKCDYQTDIQTPDKVIPMCQYALQATQRWKIKMFMKHLCPWQQSPESFFLIKVTRSSTIVSLERVWVVEYACQISSLYLLFKIIKPDNAKCSIPAHSTFVNDLDILLMTLKVDRVHPLILGKFCATFYQTTCTLEGSLSIAFKSLIQYIPIMTLTLKINRVHALILIGKSCAKLDKNTLNVLNYSICVHNVIQYIAFYLLWPWLLTSERRFILVLDKFDPKTVII